MKHVLIVEDIDEHAFLLQTQLNRLHLLTSVCTDAFLILKKLKSGIIDAITIDINLPEISGIELIRHIRNIDKSVLIIVISCMNDESIRIEAAKAGASYYLLKPYNINDLETILEPLKDENY
jgi:DNA-binding response OmpR family regulator